MRKRILYIAANDASDTRINKEIKTYSKNYIVDYLGIGNYSENSYALELCTFKYLVSGSHKSPFVIIKFLYKLKKLLKKYKYFSIHVVDEQLFFFLIPILKGSSNITLDIFDSIFLKFNKPGDKLYYLKKYVYSHANRIIVTDNARLKLLPKFAQRKAIIIPNVPFEIKYPSKNKTYNTELTLCYFGTLLQNRGSEFLYNLLESKKVRLLVAGWLGDEYTKKLIRMDNVKYLGVLKQEQINNILAKDGDYLIAIYPTNNLNNIYASPNKIYDALHTKTPIIINDGTKVAKFVKKYNTGVVLNTTDITNIDNFIDFLIRSKYHYKFENDLIKKYSWENYEHTLNNKFN